MGLSLIFDNFQLINLIQYYRIQNNQIINPKIKHRIIESLFGAVFKIGGYKAAYDYWDFLRFNDIISHIWQVSL